MTRIFSALLLSTSFLAASLIPNGSLEAPASSAAWPHQWPGAPTESIRWIQEENNHFFRLTQAEPGQLLLFYTSFPLPPNAHALRLSWRERLTHFSLGEKPWFDAQLMFSFVGADGTDLPIPKPDPEHTSQDVPSWRSRSRTFLVPEGARALAILPALFQVQSGTFDLDDFTLEAIDPAPLLQSQADAARHEAEAHVPWEDPNPAAFPLPLHVEGPRLLNSQNQEVWLQGLGSCGLESLHDDRHIHRSILVAIEQWHANCFRLPVREDFWFGLDPRQTDQGESYRKAVDFAINLCANRGVYLVLDLSRYHAPLAIHQAFWKEAARRYRNHPAVLFDLFNEPHSISWDVWRNGGPIDAPSPVAVDESAFLSDREKSVPDKAVCVGMQALLNTVRSQGASNIVIVAGNGWANDLSGIVNGFALDDPHGNGIVYSWHTYHWHKHWDRILLVLKQHPVFLGETGAAPREDMDFIPLDWKEDPYTFVPDLLGFIQKHRIHWAGWSLHPAAAPRMIQSWDYDPTPYWGIFAKQALEGKSFPLKKMR